MTTVHRATITAGFAPQPSEGADPADVRFAASSGPSLFLPLRLARPQEETRRRQTGHRRDPQRSGTKMFGK